MSSVDSHQAPGRLPPFQGLCMMNSSMDCHCLRLSELPHTSKLFATFHEHFEQVAPFYAHPPTSEGLKASAGEVNLDPRIRREVAAVLAEQNRGFGGDGLVQGNIERLEAGAVAIVTGHQVGLFTTPAYSFYKALTAVRWAQQLTDSGTDAVPIFWMATEDHDLAEVNHCFWGGRNGLERLELQHGKEVAGMRVGDVPLGNSVLELVHRAAALMEGPAAADIGGALEESYRPEESLGSAFGKLMARLLSGRGVILLDPLDKRLHRIVAGVYRKAIEASEQLTRDLVARSELLERSGYHAQVKVTDQSTLLFLNVEGRRLPLRRQGQQFAAGRAKLSESEVLDRIENAPETVTPNVLLRPIVQDALLPTAAYVGGPAETAYMAQAEVVYRQLLGRMPAILPRAGFTLVETQIARLLKKYRLTIADVLRGRQHLRRTMEQQSVPKGLARRFTENEKTLRRVLKGLQTPLGKLDQTLLGALQTSERKMLYQLTKLRGKAGRAENLRTGVLEKHERMLLDSLYPQNGLQERSLCMLPFLAAHGRELLDELEKRSGCCPAQHQVVFL